MKIPFEGQTPLIEDSQKTGCSGFAVVLRFGGRSYKAINKPDDARGITAEEVWIFGSPQRSAECDVWRSVAQCVGRVPERMIHRVPETKP